MAHQATLRAVQLIVLASSHDLHSTAAATRGDRLVLSSHRLSVGIQRRTILLLNIWWLEVLESKLGLGLTLAAWNIVILAISSVYLTWVYRWTLNDSRGGCGLARLAVEGGLGEALESSRVVGGIGIIDDKGVDIVVRDDVCHYLLVFLLSLHPSGLFGSLRRLGLVMPLCCSRCRIGTLFVLFH